MNDNYGILRNRRINIYVYNGLMWTDYTGLYGYNAFIALQNSSATFTPETSYSSTTSTSTSSAKYIVNGEINPNYGNLLTLNGMTETDSQKWNTFYYDCISKEWMAGPDAIGLINPFTDFSYASADVVLYYGPSTTYVPEIVTEYMRDKTLATLYNFSTDYRYTFDISISENYDPYIAPQTIVEYLDEEDKVWSSKTLTEDDLWDGIYIRGYGSNAYGALRWAIGVKNLTAVEFAGQNYGRILSMFGLEGQRNVTTTSGSGITHGWSVHNGSGNYLEFNLGAYSSLSYVATDTIGNTSTNYNFVCDEFTLSYD